jgi:hypothetical protein
MPEGSVSVAKTLVHQAPTAEVAVPPARRIQYIYGTTKGGGVTSVIAPDGTGSYEELTSKSNMERAIMEENESKYRQASHTPFMLPPLLGDFGCLGIGPHAHSVMHGKYETPPDVDQYTAKFIAHLHMEAKHNYYYFFC